MRHHTRRHFLQSSTAFIALPMLESLGFRRFASAAAPATPPKRMIFLAFGFGVTEEEWYPDITKPGADYELPKSLAPLARHKKDFTIVQGLWNRYSNEGHWGSTMWLTGANRYEQPGQSFHNSVSADQVAANKLGLQTRYASLQCNGVENLMLSGHGPGLSLGWDYSGKPVAGLNGPLEVYHRLFAKDTTPLDKQRALLAQKRPTRARQRAADHTLGEQGAHHSGTSSSPPGKSPMRELPSQNRSHWLRPGEL